MGERRTAEDSNQPKENTIKPHTMATFEQPMSAVEKVFKIDLKKQNLTGKVVIKNPLGSFSEQSGAVFD